MGLLFCNCNVLVIAVSLLAITASGVGSRLSARLCNVTYFDPASNEYVKPTHLQLKKGQ